MKQLTWILMMVALLWGQQALGQGWKAEFLESLGYAVAQTSDGGYIVAGEAYRPSESGSLLIKTDMNGLPIWERVDRYVTFGHQAFHSVQQTTDGGYIAAGIKKISYSPPIDRFYIVKTDANGDSLWTKTYHYSTSNYTSRAQVIEQTTDGGYIAAGYIEGSVSPNVTKAYVVKTNANGDTLWTKTYDDGSSNHHQFNDLDQTADGGYVFSGYSLSNNYSTYTVKTDASGNQQWAKKTIFSSYDNSVKQTPDGGYILSGDKHTVKTNPNGDTIWTRTYSQLMDTIFPGIDHSELILDALPLNDGYIMLAFIDNSIGAATYSNHYLIRTNLNGDTIWTKTLRELYSASPPPTKLIQTTDGGYLVLLQRNNPQLSGLLKVDSLGYSATNRIHGNIFQDNNSDCTNNQVDINLSGFTVKAENTLGNTYYATTDSTGEYSMLTSNDTYTLSIISPLNYYLSGCQGTSALIGFNGYYLQDSADFALTPSTLCPLLNVDISAPFIRATGGGSNYNISYCNTGTIDAQNAYVEVGLDPILNVLGSSLPIASQNATTYRFDIGTVAVGECGSFTVNVIADSTALGGQTVCTKANIFPDSICIPNYWTGPILEMSGLCLNDTVTFNVFNKGAPMSQGTQYFVYEDNVMFRNGTTNALGTSGNQQFREQALPGKSYRFEVKQIAGFPALLGDSVASASIEGCQPLTNGTFSTGFITQLSNGNSSPFAAVDCQQMIAAYDPNDKAAQPEGYGTPHYIYDYTPLDYRVRFQNTGTDTAFRVVIRDTLSAHLDISSVEMGAASHDYTWRIYGQGILEVTFANIMLPDSNVNEPASNGFFRFRINQVPNNPLGTVINNSAAIYFDYNLPIITNTTYHTIGDNFLSVNIITSIEETIDKDISVKVYPNPFQEQATLEVIGRDYQELQLKVFDIMGRVVLQDLSTSNKIQLQKGNLSQGVYIYQLEGDGELINTGKLIVK